MGKENVCGEYPWEARAILARREGQNDAKKQKSVSTSKTHENRKEVQFIAWNTSETRKKKWFEDHGQNEVQ